MLITIDAKCPIGSCASTTKVPMKKPGLLSPVVAAFKCAVCESDLMLKAVQATKKELAQAGTKAPDPPEGSRTRIFKTFVKLVRPSKAILDILREEAEQRAEMDAAAYGEVNQGAKDGSIPENSTELHVSPPSG